MRCLYQDWAILSIIILLALSIPSKASGKTKNKIKSAVFLSPKVELAPGKTSNKNHHDLKFPRGHIAVKNFYGELVDDERNSIPLYETYLHHWTFIKYYQPKNSTDNHDNVISRNAGLCQGNLLSQYFGLGSETRKTATSIPDPFGIEVGNPTEIPAGYDEKWMVNLHAIDTRGVEDRIGCIECKCDLYNATKEEKGQSLRLGYKGGSWCCKDNAQCRLKEGHKGSVKTVYFRYTVEWVDWDNSIVPLKVYVFDVTDTIKISNGPSGLNVSHNCLVEYDIEACNTSQKYGGGCVDLKKTSFPMKTGGYVIYGVAHQHTGVMGSTLYGQDGSIICTSLPKNGKGKKARNEKGYIVGMTTCYPQAGSVKIIEGETLTIVSKYNNKKQHIGLMGLFYLLVAEQI